VKGAKTLIGLDFGLCEDRAMVFSFVYRAFVSLLVEPEAAV
jgi:hypothetical protein